MAGEHEVSRGKDSCRTSVTWPESTWNEKEVESERIWRMDVPNSKKKVGERGQISFRGTFKKRVKARVTLSRSSPIERP